MKKFTPYLLLFPALFLIIIFKLCPIFSNVIGSLFTDAGFSFENYSRIFQDSTFWAAFKNTIVFSFIVTPLQIFLALVMAFLVNVKVRGITVFRTLIYIPVVISLTVACMIWGIMLNPSSGIFNSMLIKLGMQPQTFLTSSNQALMCIVVICSWKGIAYWMMFLLAGLQSISNDIYEAGKIDGANWWNMTTKITIPLLNRPLIFVIVSDTISNMLLFTPMYILTNGGPKESTNVLMFEAYKAAFVYSDNGRSCAIITILLLMILVIVGSEMKFLKRDY
jgi:ABC-type sugar transport system permease subunit